MRTAWGLTRASTLVLTAGLAAGGGCYRYAPIETPAQPAVGAIDSREPVDSAAWIDVRQTPPAAGGSVTVAEEEAVQRALARSGEVDAQRSQLAIVAARSRGAGALDNPELRLNRRTADDPLERLEVGVRWRVPRLWALGAERDRWRAQEGLEEVDLEWVLQDVAELTRTTCAELGYLTAMEESQTVLVTGLHQVVRLVQGQVRMGTASDLELRTAQFVLLEAESDLQQLVHRRAQAQDDLVYLTGIAAPVRTCVPTDTPSSLDLGPLLTLAWDHRPELQETRWRHRQAAARLHLERAEAIPWLSFIGPAVRFDSRPGGIDGTGETAERTWFEFQIGIDLPIFDRNSGNIRAETLALEAEVARAELLTRDIQQQVTDALRRYEMAATALLELERSATDRLADADELLAGALHYGTVDPDWAFDIVRRRAGAVQALARQRLRVEQARVDLYVALGIVALDPSVLF
jgi:outer membrane protein TolC